MKIVDLLSMDSILLDGRPGSKADAIDMLIDLQMKSGKISDKEKYKKGIIDREAMSSTAVGEGIAIPHAKSAAVTAPSLAAMTVPQSVDYEAMDGEPSKLLFMIAAPNDGDIHLEVLSRLMTILMDENFREKLIAAKTKSEFIKIIDETEKEKYPDIPVNTNENPGYEVLAVTACPTGIAHTYMAAEALEKAGKKLGISVKVETNGSGGAKNILTKEDIENCAGIIVAADKTVEMSRFDGKKVIITRVADGIKLPEELINRIKSGDAPVYRHTGGKASEISAGNEGVGRQLYKHLMNGVSNMLPFTVAGGIFIALAFLIDTLSGAPQDGSFGANTPAAEFFKTIGGFAFEFMIPVLAGYIGMSIADRPGFLVGLVGGYLAASGSTFASVGGDVPSGFLGALLAGFAGGYAMLLIERSCDKLSKQYENIFIKKVRIYAIYPPAARSPAQCMFERGFSCFIRN